VQIAVPHETGYGTKGTSHPPSPMSVLGNKADVVRAPTEVAFLTRSGLRAGSLSKLDRVPFPHSLPGRKVLVLSIAEGLALGLWGRLMLRREFIILGGGVAVLPRAARAQLAIMGFSAALSSRSRITLRLFVIE